VFLLSDGYIANGAEPWLIPTLTTLPEMEINHPTSPNSNGPSNGNGNGHGYADSALPSVSRLVREFVTSVQAAQNLLVTKTSVGSAQPVAAALDGENWPEAIGTIAGDDTILIVCTDSRSAGRLAGRIQGMLA